MCPAIAAIAINDGAASPASHTFNPVTTDGSLAKWADRAAGVPAGYITISEEVLEPAGGRTTSKITWGFYLPTMGVDALGNPILLRYSSGQLTLNIHPQSTLAERKNLFAYVKNFLANATVQASVENVEPFY